MSFPEKGIQTAGLEVVEWGGVPPGSTQGEQNMQPAEMNKTLCPENGKQLDKQPEERTYQACKLDPGVNRLRLSVPHSVHQPDRGPAGPWRSLPAGVRLQQMSSGQAGVRGRTE